MKVFVSIDMEGCGGVVSAGQTRAGAAAYADGRALMRADLDAALEGCVAAGAGAVVVCDAHGAGAGLSAEGLPAGCTLVGGLQPPLGMMSGLDESFDAALLVGYHARAGTRAAVLDHTFSSTVFRVRVDDAIEAGELALNAAVAGAFGVPVAFVSGDDKLAAEAREALPGATVAVVKQGLTRTSARLLPAALVRERIARGVEEALGAALPPPAPPWHDSAIRIVFTRSDFCDAAATCPGVERVDARSVRIEGGDYLGAYATLTACIDLADAESRQD